MKNLKGQVTIFIIIGILLVSMVVLFFMLKDDVNLPDIGGSRTKVNPPAFLDSCLENKIKEATIIIGKQGGYINPKFQRLVTFPGEGPSNIAYLCYQRNFDKPCIPQEPLLIDNIEKEIANYISNEVEICFTQLGVSLGDQGYVVNSNYRSFNVDLTPKRITTNINAEIILTKSGETSRQEDFTFSVPSNIYDLARIAQRIIIEESSMCEFNTLDFMLNNPDYSIERFTTSDSSTIYSIGNRNTNELFRFVVRGCVLE